MMGLYFFCYYALSIGTRGPNKNMVLHLLLQDITHTVFYMPTFFQTPRDAEGSLNISLELKRITIKHQGVKISLNVLHMAVTSLLKTGVSPLPHGGRNTEAPHFPVNNSSP